MPRRLPPVRIRYVRTRILVVDDSPQFRAVAVELLTVRGFEPLGAAADGEQALAAVADTCPDGILLDIGLPGTDGFTLSSSLAAVCPAARIVLTSADVHHVQAKILKACAATAFVPKQELATVDLSALFRPRVI